MLFILHSKANRDKECALSQIQCSTITLLAGETSGNLPNKLSFQTNNCMVLEGGGRGYWVKLLQPRVTMGQIFLCDYFPNPSLIFPVFTCLGSIEWAVFIKFTDTCEFIPFILLHDLKGCLRINSADTYCYLVRDIWHANNSWIS